MYYKNLHIKRIQFFPEEYQIVDVSHAKDDGSKGPKYMQGPLIKSSRISVELVSENGTEITVFQPCNKIDTYLHALMAAMRAGNTVNLEIYWSVNM